MSTVKLRQAALKLRPRKLSKAEQQRMAARDRLVIDHLDWARGIAAAVAKRLPTWFTVEDLVGPAEIGLVQAASRYDSTRNDNFMAYAQQRVYGACIQSVRRREYKERGHFALEDRYTSSAASPDQQAQSSITRQKMWARVGELPAANARVLRSHYFAGQTLVEIARRMEVSESWVCRLHRDGLQMLRARCADLKEAA